MSEAVDQAYRAKGSTTSKPATPDNEDLFNKIGTVAKAGASDVGTALRGYAKGNKAFKSDVKDFKKKANNFLNGTKIGTKVRDTGVRMLNDHMSNLAKTEEGRGKIREYAGIAQKAMGSRGIIKNPFNKWNYVGAYANKFIDNSKTNPKTNFINPGKNGKIKLHSVTEVELLGFSSPWGINDEC
jgi:hypothetical protein